MLKKCIEANPAKFAMYAKVATIIGWVILIAAGVMLLPTIFQYYRIMRHWSRFCQGIIQIINPIFFGMVFLLLAQFLKYELGLDKQPGWFFRNGCIILRCDAALILFIIIFQCVLMIGSLVRSNGPLGDIFLAFFSMSLFYILQIAEMALLLGLAEVTKMMMAQIRKDQETQFAPQ